ncbi:TIGR02281 family clan AA aspartic protease [Methylobacterium sp. Leaf108]|uniref:retropepsin-like aspartic protease family protein n=1 Tax=Methylobacterium sp. Leaf108 TaxID=1736256 RepID=UPI0006F57622|nr:TIGR02281 family clan AA aspartic protease [Methylobacterium sp. Leaf108]KQP52640.1 histidine kinase [Methylobacterium sp. Leaf108]
MIYLAIGVLGIALVALVLNHGEGRIVGLEPEQLAGLAGSGALLAMIAAGFWGEFRSRMGENLRALAIWGLLGLACVGAYAYRDEAREVGNRIVGELRPGSATTGPGGSVTIARRAGGDFQVRAAVNGRVQTFVFDTGASAVVLTAENAAALSLTPKESEFSVRISTANGTTVAAPAYLDSLAVGDITLRRVSALISRPGALSDNLLGMSFLSRLGSYEVRGDRLTLRAP